MKGRILFSIVIPAYNEEKNIGKLLKNIIKISKKEKWKNFEIIVVNDNSKDATKKVIQSLKKKNKQIFRIDRVKGNNGMGYSLIEGTKAARGELILWTMADLSDDVNAYGRMIEGIKSNRYDMIFGSRFVKGGSSGDITPYKAFLSRIFSLCSRLLHGVKVNDLTNAFRAFRKEIFLNA
ncbi:MAG: glycosyltransferase family 2 protein, partial [Nanoarchaeota archaeon]